MNIITMTTPKVKRSDIKIQVARIKVILFNIGILELILLKLKLLWVVFMYDL